MTQAEASPKDILVQAQTRLSRTDRKIVRYLIDHYTELPFTTAKEIAEQVDRNPSTITRLLQKLGYNGYPDFRAAARSDLRQMHDYASQFRTHQPLNEWWKLEEKNFHETETIIEETQEQVMRMLLGARTLYFMGAKFTEPMALIGSMYLRHFRSNVHKMPNNADQLPEMLRDIQPQDLVVIFAVRRYPKPLTLVAQYLAKRNIPILLISDGGPSSIVRICEKHVILPVKSVGNFVTAVAFFEYISALAVLMATQIGVDRLKSIERDTDELLNYEY